MKFIINTTNLQSGGALQVALSLLEEWNLVPGKNEFHVFLSPQLDLLVDQNGFNDRFIFYSFKKNPGSSIINSLTFYKKLSRLEKQINPDAVLTVFGPALWKPRSKHLVGFANGYYLFDDSDFIQNRIVNDIFRRIKYYTRRYLLFSQLKKEGNQYWVETAKAKEILSAVIHKPLDNISVIGNTYGSSLKNVSIHKPKINDGFNLLFVSAYYPHKNFEIIVPVVEILTRLKINCRFVCTLRQIEFEVISQHIKDLKFLQNAGYTTKEHLATLYREADAVFMPSLLETFSANYPEAMKMELPIICSDFDFSRNICGDAALYFNAQDPKDIVNKIIELIENKELQKRLVEAGKRRLEVLETPESRADKIIALLDRIASEK